MSKTQAGYLKAITGVLLINKDGNDMLCCLEDMQLTKYFTIGQIFNAVRVLNAKTVDQYGKLWPRYKDENENVSNDWKYLQSVYESSESDYDFLVAACEQLKEEVPAIVPRAEVEKRIQLTKDALASISE